MRIGVEPCVYDGEGVSIDVRLGPLLVLLLRETPSKGIEPVSTFDRKNHPLTLSFAANSSRIFPTSSSVSANDSPLANQTLLLVSASMLEHMLVARRYGCNRPRFG